MSDNGDEAPPAKQITFNVKSSSDAKHVISVPEDITVLDLKTKLSTPEFADVPAERQRLIYSGRVLKDADPLSTYKIKDGNTVHMVKGAASNQRQEPQSQGSSGASNPAANVPTNIATGTGTDPLAGLTGARYAGFAQMPGAEAFGADGGMGAPRGPEDMMRMLENPMFASQMNEAMNNPDVIRMMQNSPMVRNNPFLRQALENPEFRRQIMDPNAIRQSIQMQRMMGGGGQGQASMPAPGVTDTTPQQAQQNGQNQTNPTGSPPPNPFGMGLGAGGGMGMRMGMGGQQGNPFAALFGGQQQPPSTTPSAQIQSQSPSAGQTGSTEGGTGNQQQTMPNPFGSMFGAPQQGQGQGQNAFQAMAQQMMQNPEMMQQAMQMMGGMGQTGGQQGEGQSQDPAAQGNPFANMFGPGAGSGAGGNPFGGMFGGGGGMPQQAQDSRPPEEQYADQLRQLNEMGFFEFDRNVRALRMAGGNVSGAIEMLFSGTI